MTLASRVVRDISSHKQRIAKSGLSKETSDMIASIFNWTDEWFFMFSISFT